MKLSPITKNQIIKIAKAAAYSFAAALVAGLVATDSFDRTTLYALLVSALNTAFVTVKQAFTEDKKK